MEQNTPRWRQILGKMFLGVALAINNLLGGALGGQIVQIEHPDERRAAAPPNDPSRRTIHDAGALEHNTDSERSA